MSQQDVDTIRGAYEAFGRQDIDGLMAAFDDGIEWDVPDSVPWGGQYRGKEEVGRFFGGLGEYIDELNVEPREYIDAGDTVVVLGRHHGNIGGEPFETRFAMVWTMDGGKAVKFKEYSDMTPLARLHDAKVAA